MTTDDLTGDESAGFSDGAIRLLSSYLAPPRPPAALPTEATLVGFLAGTLSPDEAEATARLLSRHAPARQHLRTVARTWEATQRRPWAQVAGLRDTDTHAGEVGRVWLSLVAGRVAAFLDPSRDAFAAPAAPRFAVARGAAPADAPEEDTATVYAAVLTGPAGDATGTQMPLRLDGEPHLDGDTLRLALALPAPVRRDYAHYDVVIALATGADADDSPTQQLAVYPVSQWTDDAAQELAIPCPGLGERLPTLTLPAALLRVALQPQTP